MTFTSLLPSPRACVPTPIIPFLSSFYMTTYLPPFVLLLSLLPPSHFHNHMLRLHEYLYERWPWMWKYYIGSLRDLTISLTPSQCQYLDMQVSVYPQVSPRWFNCSSQSLSDCLQLHSSLQDQLHGDIFSYCLSQLHPHAPFSCH